MIKFFRRTRRNLMEQNKTSKYFKYAIGEIVLVVIGILIALQINNWNENKKEKIKSLEFHNRIVEDLDLMIEYLENEIKRSEKVKNSIVKATQILKSGQLTKSNKETLDYALKNYYQMVRIEESLNSIDELKNSGQFGLIYNKKLKTSIDRYSGYLSVISKIVDQLSQQVNKDEIIGKYIFIDLSNNSDGNKIFYDFRQIQKDEAFINRFSKFAVNWKTKKEFNTSLLNSSKKLKNQIQKELDK